MIKYKSPESDRIKGFILQGIDLNKQELQSDPDPFWQKLKSCGTELWLDTGDLDEAAKIWTPEMSALTTNNTLLNNEIQKGIYDKYIAEANNMLEDLDLASRILEIAFVLNARHGMRLVEHFRGNVSVELHTDFAHDYDGIVEYGQRFYEMCPDHFIIKVPYTPTGLLGARRLRELGVPINFTLEFSARQNALVAAISKPNYLNLFLGRLGAYMIDNNLGDGKMIGEKATLSTQKIVALLARKNVTPTKLIAASLRNATQLCDLAGVNVFTIPTKVAAAGKDSLSGDFVSKIEEEYPVSLNPGVSSDEIGFEKLWELSANELSLAKDLDQNPPADGMELVERARERGCADMFPELSEADYQMISDDGKIPVHKNWADRIAKGELAIDTLLNLAGLASFTADQKKLDDRIESIIA